jgi:glyoxylase-like metal-dependent hydrolase (beta-lactamase superfamily II)
MRGQPTEIVPGIVRVPDFWSQTLIKQNDGIVIFEAHISAQYLHDVMAEAHKRWPNAPIKAIVMTSDPWAHLGGVREAMALGLPIYIHANSVPFLSRLASAPHRLEPDSLAKSHRAPRIIPVSSKTTIGTGDDRIELYPVNGAGDGEQMLMAYFPAHRLLYGADLVFPNRSGRGFLETEGTDLRRAVAREGLDPESVFSVQNYGPFKWADFAGR